MIPEELWLQIASTINILTIAIVLWFASKIYKNIIKAHQRPIYNSVEYKGCNLYPEKTEVHNH